MDAAPVRGLDDPCPVCDRVSGDHTLREWAACLGTTTEDLPYAPIAEDAAEFANARLRQQLNLDSDMLVADHCVVRAAAIDASSGPLAIKLPLLIHEFGMGLPGGPPASIAKVAFLGSADSMRGYGRLVRDSANAAVNAAARL